MGPVRLEDVLSVPAVLTADVKVDRSVMKLRDSAEINIVVTMISVRKIRNVTIRGTVSMITVSKNVSRDIPGIQFL